MSLYKLFTNMDALYPYLGVDLGERSTTWTVRRRDSQPTSVECRRPRPLPLPARTTSLDGPTLKRVATHAPSGVRSRTDYLPCFPVRGMEFRFRFDPTQSRGPLERSERGLGTRATRRRSVIRPREGMEARGPSKGIA